MDRHYYGLKALVVVVALAIGGATAMMPTAHYQSSVAHLQYGAAMEAEMAVLHATSKITHVVAGFLRSLR